jgi:hypothetical protein
VHSLRRSLALFAAWLVVLQAFLAGIAIAQSGAVLAVDPVDAAIICHGAGGPAPADSPAGLPADARHLCCTACTSAAAPVMAPAALTLVEMRPGRDLEPIGYLPFITSVSRGAVRAGPSQAPPAAA